MPINGWRLKRSFGHIERGRLYLSQCIRFGPLEITCTYIHTSNMDRCLRFGRVFCQDPFEPCYEKTGFFAYAKTKT